MSKSESDWQRIKEIFAELIEQPLPHRSAILTLACGGDLSVLAAIEELLSRHRQSAGMSSRAIGAYPTENSPADGVRETERPAIPSTRSIP
jgi:hypothetical protein